MRSNLLSLQNISKQQNQTQLRLSTGLKVNSAIDNPSSYYTAQSLANRAADLSSLLDAMGQGIQIIKSANEGIEVAQNLIEQMKSIAEQVSPNVPVPDKEYFLDKVGANGAVVSTADELRAAINDGKETICVYGKIDLGDISTTGGITLAENQKLVGVEYFGHFANGEGFSKISGIAKTVNQNLITINNAGGVVSDLSINYENDVVSGGNLFASIMVSSSTATAELRNLDINVKTNYDNTVSKDAICVNMSANVYIGNKINIQTSGGYSRGIEINNNSSMNILSDAVVNINTSSNSGYALYSLNSSQLNILTGARVDVTVSGKYASGIFSHSSANNSIATGALVKINAYENADKGIEVRQNSNFTIGGEIQIFTVGAVAISSSSTIDILSTARLDLKANQLMSTNATGQINLAGQAKVAVENDGQKKWYELQADDNVNGAVSVGNIEAQLNVAETEPWQTVTAIWEEKSREDKENETFTLVMTDELSSYQQQYNKVLAQYDQLLADSTYKGVNLLKGDAVKINFNEDRSSSLDVQGEDLSSDKIGLTKSEWGTYKDVQESLAQVLSVTNILRETASTLGNYYSIITTRSDFTDNLINVLEEGADKLTLADMNEESANMLALQTRQSLAVNALSLASQANQAILKLF